MKLKIIFWCLTVYLQFYRCICKRNETVARGMQVKVEDVPYLILVTTESRNRWCSGALINEQYILTSAHCAYSYYGFAEITGSKDEENLLVPCKFILHEAYTDLMNLKEATSHDIAFAKLEFKIIFSNFVEPIKIELPAWPLNITTQKKCKIVGFYKIGDHYHRLITTEYLVKYGYKNCDCIPFKHVLCIKGDKGGLCIGENGSLLICDKKLVALHSRRFPDDICITNETMRIPKCDREKSLNVFTYLPSHIGWIQQYVVITDHSHAMKEAKLKSSASFKNKIQPHVFFALIIYYIYL